MVFTGCNRIDRFSITRPLKLRQLEPPKVELPPPVDRILAAIVVRTADSPGGAPPEAAWFFKLAGPVEEVNTQADMFEKFISSVHFVDDRPAYDAPPDWKPQGESRMRFETFEIPGSGEKPLELTVTTLPRGEQDDSEFEQASISRWRSQLESAEKHGGKTLNRLAGCRCPVPRPRSSAWWVSSNRREWVHKSPLFLEPAMVSDILTSGEPMTRERPEPRSRRGGGLLYNLLAPLASLRLTVVLFALA